MHASIDYCLVSLLSLSRPRLVAAAHVLCLNYLHVSVGLRGNAGKTTVVLFLPEIRIWHYHFVFCCNCAVKSNPAWANLPAIGCKEIFRGRLSLLKGCLHILLISCGLLPCNCTSSPSLKVWLSHGTRHTCFEGHLINASILGPCKRVAVHSSLLEMRKAIGSQPLLVSPQLFFLFNRS